MIKGLSNKFCLVTRSFDFVQKITAMQYRNDIKTFIKYILEIPDKTQALHRQMTKCIFVFVHNLTSNAFTRITI